MKNSQFFLTFVLLLLTAWGLWASCEMKVTQKIEELSVTNKLMLVSDALSASEEEHSVYEVWVETPEKVVVLETSYGNFYNTELVNRLIITIDDIEKVSCDEKVRIQNEYKELCRINEEAEQEEKSKKEILENLNKKLCVD